MYMRGQSCPNAVGVHSHRGRRRRDGIGVSVWGVNVVSLFTGKSPGRASREGREECADIFRNKEIRSVEG